MKALTHRTAPLGAGWLPCVRCRRYRHPDDLADGYCISSRGCTCANGPTAAQKIALRQSRPSLR